MGEIFGKEAISERLPPSRGEGTECLKHSGRILNEDN